LREQEQAHDEILGIHGLLSIPAFAPKPNNASAYDF